MIKIPLRLLRMACNCTIEEAAKIYEVTPSMVESFEQDTSEIPVKTIQEIHLAYNFPLDLIYIGKERDCIKENREIIGL